MRTRIGGRDAGAQAEAWLAREAARAQKRVKQEQRGPSAEAQQEERNAPKNLDHTAVAKNAEQYFPS